MDVNQSLVSTECDYQDSLIFQKKKLELQPAIIIVEV